MAFYSWRNASNGGGGAFDAASNWSNPNESVSTSVPTAGDTADLASGGGAISGSGSVDTIAFTSAAWSIAGQITASTVTLDGGSLTAGTVGGQLVVNGALQVGLGSSASLAIVNGGVIAVASSAAGRISNFGAATLFVASRGIASFGGGLNFGINSNATTSVVTGAAMTVGGIFQIGASTGGATSSLAISGGGQVILSAPTDTSTPYLKLGAVSGGSGSLSVDGATSILLLANNSGAVGYLGSGTLTVTSGGQARFNASANSDNNALNPALTLGRFGNGTVTVAGANSLVAAGGSIIVGGSGQGVLRVQSGAGVTSTSFVPGQAALAVGASGGSGAVVIDGSGTSFVASGATILGGDNRGSGLMIGGAGTLSVTGGALFQTVTATILSGSSASVDASSQLTMSGDLYAIGSLASAGTFYVGGALYGGGLIQIGGGIADIGALGAAGNAPVTMAFTAATATVRLHGLVGANTISSMQPGDEIDLLGNTSVRLTGTIVTTTTGTIALSAAPTGTHYALNSDGAGGTFVALSADTVGVYRFFDSNYGTHFFSASGSEKGTILATRPDLIYEGVGLQSIDPASPDPMAAPVFRFFDTTYGTHFFTASTSERDAVIGSRPDLVFEGTGFIEHTAQQSGDTAVYRFFDTKYGTHFYTADANERATIVATRPDLVDEGTGFYAPTM